MTPVYRGSRSMGHGKSGFDCIVVLFMFYQITISECDTGTHLIIQFCELLFLIVMFDTYILVFRVCIIINNVITNHVITNYVLGHTGIIWEG